MKFKDTFWVDVVRLEQRVRLRLGIFAQWRQSEGYIILEDTLSSWFVLILEQ